MRLGIETTHIGASLEPCSEYFPAVRADHRFGKRGRPIGKPEKFTFRFPRPPETLMQKPQILLPALVGAKYIIPSIGTPRPAAIIGRIIPARQQGMEIGSICRRLPQGVSFLLCHAETKRGAIRPPSEPEGDTIDVKKMTAVGAVAFHGKNLLTS